ncbi:MAG: hypothetical protein OEM26_13865 [Saprospiraceae bacterium]|nr:hypothetical protein [Saprospiraceae bacterium]
MKRILPIYLFSGLLLFSCADDSLSPIITFDKAGKGAYVRLVEEGGSKLVNLFDIAGSQYNYSVEFVDQEQGNLVAEYKLDITFVDNTPDNGNNSTGPVSFKSFSPGDFSNTERGYKGLSGISLPANDVISAVGLTAADLGPGDIFRIQGFVVLTDGSVFGKANSSAAVNGSAFQGHFDFDLTASCPSTLAGTYDVQGSNFWCGEPDAAGSVTIEALGGGSYTFDDWSFLAYPACYGGLAASWGTLSFKDVCNEVSFTGFTDNYGDTWEFTSEVNGSEWTISWVNTYGEAGTAVITNSGGADWPFTLK